MVGQMVKPLTKFKIQPGPSVVLADKTENIEWFLVNEVSGQIFCPIKNLSGAVCGFL